MIGIYKITNPEGAIYIGQSINIKRRFDQYRRIDKSVKTSPKLYDSLIKYGFENHNFEVLLECNRDELNEKERFYQEKYNATSKSNLNYFLTKTKDKKGVGKPISSKQKAQISKVHKGKKLSEQTKAKIRLARSRQVITEEHKRKISENSGSSRLVLTGIFYDSAKKASIAHNINHNALVCRLINRIKNKTDLIYV